MAKISIAWNTLHVQIAFSKCHFLLTGARVLRGKMILLEGGDVREKSGTSCPTSSKEGMTDYRGRIRRIKELL